MNTPKKMFFIIRMDKKTQRAIKVKEFDIVTNMVIVQDTRL